MNLVSHKILFAIIWVITLLPLWFFYMLSSLVFIIMFYVVPYRKAVVVNNLKNAFPDKSDREINIIARSFFHHFVDFMFESVKNLNISEKEHRKRCLVNNIEILDELYNRGKNIVLVSGHYGNWEWFNILPVFIKHRFYCANKELHSSFSDILIRDIRQKYGMIMVKMEDTYKTIINAINKNEKIVVWLLADQRPPKNAEYWTTFLNQDTAFFLGAGKMVKKLDLAMVFLDIQKYSRGKYIVNFELLADSANDLDEYQITELHVKKLESVIRNKPDYWLWSHKRWKHKKPLLAV